MHPGGYIWLICSHNPKTTICGPGWLCEAPHLVVSLRKWFMAARFLSLWWSNRLQLSQSMQACREVNLVGGGGNVIHEYGMTPSTQHLETLSDGRVGSAGFNLSQCKVILLWLPGAYARAQTQTTHTNRFRRLHTVILVKECLLVLYL